MILVLAVLVSCGGAGGCVFDKSGQPFDDNNNSNDNATNSNNGNGGNSNNNNEVTAVCGNGVIEGAEGCDDDNATSDDGCGADCQPEAGWVCNGAPSVCEQTCGNGVVDGGEGCDDSNTVPMDGCDGQCQVEPGWDCSSLVCVPDCGDSLVVGLEGCDDGGTAPGDGCAADCTVEDFYACEGAPSMCHCVIYVDQDTAVPLPRTGGSWEAALSSVQQGINTATAGCEVWVADGTYHIRQSSADNTVALKSDVSVYGGFAGGETELSQRNLQLNAAVLHGANPGLTARVYHVVSANSVTGAVLNGFIVTWGDAWPGRHGGGINIVDSTLTLSQLRVEGNNADVNGGGLYTFNSSVLLRRSIIESNDANDGGGVSADSVSKLDVERCRFIDNRAEYYGGGLRVFDRSGAVVSNSLFVDNEAATNFGGAIINHIQTDLTLINSTIFRNQAAISGGAIRNVSGTSCVVHNSILWGNTPDDFSSVSTTVTMSYSIAEDTDWAGTNGNLSVDPLLVVPGFRLGSASPAIDTANDALAPPDDLGGNARVDILAVGTPGTDADMGCFEYTP